MRAFQFVSCSGSKVTINHKECPLGFGVLEKTFFLWRKTFFYAKKACCWNDRSSLRVNLIVSYPVDFLAGFYSFSLRLCRFFWKIRSVRLLIANVFFGALRPSGARDGEWGGLVCFSIFVFFVFSVFWGIKTLPATLCLVSKLVTLQQWIVGPGSLRFFFVFTAFSVVFCIFCVILTSFVWRPNSIRSSWEKRGELKDK